MAQFKESVSFNEAHFNKKALFTSIRSEKSFSLHNAHFKVAPDFNEAAFHAPPVLDDVRIDEQLLKRQKGPFASIREPGKNAAKISRNFRALGKMAHEARDWLNEMEFFAQETRTRRFGLDFPLGEWRWLRKLVWRGSREFPDWKWPREFALWLRRKVKASPYRGPNAGRFWFGFIYEKASNFGRSFARPFTFWAFSIFAFTCIYSAIAIFNTCQAITCAYPAFTSSDSCMGFGCISSLFAWGSPLWDALTLSWRQGLVVPGLVRNSHYEHLLTRLFDQNPGNGVFELSNWIYFLASIQTLVSAFFLFLFFLAVRNHFRIR